MLGLIEDDLLDGSLMGFMHFMKLFEFHGLDGEDVVGHFVSNPEYFPIGSLVDFSLGDVAVTIKHIIDELDFFLHF